jgi:multiple sugar transport system permease protein
VSSRVTARGEGRTPSPRAGWRAAQDRAGAAFGLPFFVGFLVVFVLPVLYALYQSLFKTQAGGGLGLSGTTTVFAGLENYARALTDQAFWEAMLRVAVFAAVQIPISLGLSLTAALLLDAVVRERRGNFFRALLLVPYMVPAVVASLIWVYLYSPQVGPLTGFGDLLGLDVNFFSPGMLWISIGNLIVWMVLGFNMLIIYGALRGIDPGIIEAARVDGASPFRIAWSIKIPSIRGTLVLTGLISIIGMLQIFNEPLLFRAASPETVSQNFTPIMAIYFQAFTSNNYNYAAALSIVLAVIIGLISSGFYRLTTRKENA